MLSRIFKALTTPSSVGLNGKDQSVSRFLDTVASSTIESCVEGEVEAENLKEIVVQEEQRIVLVLDVDETLLHTTSCALSNEEGVLEMTNKCDFTLEYGGFIYGVTLRPHLNEFLNWAKEEFELVVFSAGRKEYIVPLMKKLDPEGNIFRQVFHREHCVPTTEGVVSGGDGGGEPSYLKDLHVLNKPMERVILVDNSAHSFRLQPNNGVPITSFFSDKEDKALLSLKEYLRRIIGTNDVRPHLSQSFNLQDFFFRESVRKRSKGTVDE